MIKLKFLFTMYLLLILLINYYIIKTYQRAFIPYFSIKSLKMYNTCMNTNVSVSICKEQTLLWLKIKFFHYHKDLYHAYFYSHLLRPMIWDRSKKILVSTILIKSALHVTTHYGKKLTTFDCNQKYFKFHKASFTDLVITQMNAKIKQKSKYYVMNAYILF